MLFSGQGLQSLAFHDGSSRKANQALKYKNNPALAETLAGRMDTYWPEPLSPKGNPVPVPLALDQARPHGFNQAEVVARHLGQRRHWPGLPSVLQRTRNTPAQLGLNASQRWQNRSGAFSAGPLQVRGLDFILIDEVCIAGATVGPMLKHSKSEGPVWFGLIPWPEPHSLTPI